MKIIRNKFALYFLLLGIAVLGIESNLLAQEESAQQAQPEMPTIDNIVVNFTGLSNVNEEVVRANMSIREGEKFDQIAIDRDIRNLYKTRLFEFIEVRLRETSSEKVDVIFDVRPKFRIASVSFEGNEAVRDAVLENKIEIEVNQVLNERKVKADAATLKELYLKKGFFKARVDYNIDRNPGTGYGNVTFKITEGGKFKIKAIVFEGNENLPKKKLTSKMKTKKWGFFSFLTGSGKFDSDQFEDDLENVRDTYRKEGYLDVEVDQSKVQFSYPSKKRMRIDINLTEGKQYRVGKVNFEGNEIYSDEILSMLLRVRPGEVYQPEKLDEDVNYLEDFYGQFGYMETRVRMNRIPNVKTGDIDITYQFYESDKFEVESIDIEGNTKTKSTVIIRELSLGPGSSFDSVRMDASRMKLENTRFFENVNVSPQSTNIPGRKDLKVSFQEGRTGNFSFGAGFSSLEQGTFFVELTQSNFDIFNWRGAFQGDGQKFRLKATLGTYTNNLVLAFEEPWLFERRLALGFQIFNTTTDYEDGINGSTVEGFEVYLRKRLLGLVEGRLTYGYSNQSYEGYAEIDAVDGDYREFLLENSIGVTSRVNLLLLRDTRDRIINTFRGNRITLDLTTAGGMLGGDFDFVKAELQNAFYLPISRAHTQTVEVLLRAGVADSYEGGNQSFVPREQRFFLGGPNTLRGFEYRDVGPQENGYASGGKTYGMVGVEYSIGFSEGFRGALFYDGGFVNKDAADFSFDQYWNDNYGFGIRINVMGTPLRLDYAIPMTKDDNNQNTANSQFNFSFGGRF